MSTPASLNQVSKFVGNALGGPDSAKMQYLLANTRLFKQLAFADFSKIDEAAFAASLVARPTSINWTPVSEYAEKITARSKLRDWGLTKTQIDAFAATLKDHVGPLQPTGISLWLGRDLQYNWDEAIAWLNDEVTTRNEKLKPYFDTSSLSFFPGSEQSGKRKLTAVGLDIDTFWYRTNGISPREARKQRAIWPGLEVAWLLALNPQVYLGIDYETIPAFWAPGLVVYSVSVPCFHHDADEAFVVAYRDGSQWFDGSVVSFREY